ncbi:HRAS-like suppressor 3 [Arapaima gigas]
MFFLPSFQAEEPALDKDASLPNIMAPTLFDQKPEPGDLIEISRGNYQHWAIYVGNGYVIHLCPPSEDFEPGGSSLMSALCDKAVVKEEEFWKVVNDDKYTINNLLDDKYEPRNIRTILAEARRMVGRELPYCFIRHNCEHFVTELRYGKAESRQVRQAAQTAVAAGAVLLGVGVLAAVATSFFGSKKKERKDEY